MNTLPENMSKFIQIKCKKENDGQLASTTHEFSPERKPNNPKNVDSPSRNSDYSKMALEVTLLPLDAKDVYRLKSTWKAVHRKVDEAGIELFLQYDLHLISKYQIMAKCDKIEFL